MENLIDGKSVAARVRARVAARVAQLESRTGVQTGLATIKVGDDPASAVYVAGKHRACQEAGMASVDISCRARSRRPSSMPRSTRSPPTRASTA